MAEPSTREQRGSLIGGTGGILLAERTASRLGKRIRIRSLRKAGRLTRLTRGRAWLKGGAAGLGVLIAAEMLGSGIGARLARGSAPAPLAGTAASLAG